MSDDGRLSEEDLEHLAELARLTLSDEEVSEFQSKLEELLEHCEKLSEVPEVEEEADLENVFAPEELSTNLDHEQATQNAETTEDGEFRGPAVGDGA